MPLQYAGSMTAVHVPCDEFTKVLNETNNWAVREALLQGISLLNVKLVPADKRALQQAVKKQLLILDPSDPFRRRYIVHPRLITG